MFCENMFFGTGVVPCSNAHVPKTSVKLCPFEHLSNSSKMCKLCRRNSFPKFSRDASLALLIVVFYCRYYLHETSGCAK